MVDKKKASANKAKPKSNKNWEVLEGSPKEIDKQVKEYINKAVKPKKKKKAVKKTVKENSPKIKPVNNKKNGKKTEKFVEAGKATRFTKKKQPSPKAKSKGWDARRGRLAVADMIFEGMMKKGTIKEVVKHSHKKAAKGDLKDSIDLIKIITPKDVNLDASGDIIIHLDKQDKDL